MKSKKVSQLLKVYLEARENGKEPYFDADQIEQLLDSFEETDDFTYYDEVLALGLKLHPFNSDLQIRKCKKALFDGQYTKALQLLDSMSINDDADVDLIRMQCYAALGHFDKIIAFIEQLQRNDCDYLEYVYEELAVALDDLEKFREAQQIIQDGLRLFPNNQILKEELCYVNECEAKYPEAIRICNELIDENPFSNDYWFTLARLYLINRDYEKAVEACDFAQTCDPKFQSDPDLLMLKVYGLYLNESYEKALEVFNESLLNNSDQTDRLRPIIAECYLRMGDREKCYEIMQNYSTTDEQISDNYISVFRVCMELDQKEEAVHSLLEAYQKFPQDLRVLCLLTLHYLDEQQPDEALIYFRKIEEVIRSCPLNNDDAQILFQAGQALYIQDWAEEALTLFRKAFEINPKLPDQDVFYAISYAKLGDMARFSDYISEAAEPQAKEGKEIPDKRTSLELVKRYLANKDNNN
ncbi:MAG: tetratricopeptide repeat protein [Parabacteroides sp.]